MIRLWLAHANHFPWHAIAFLNDACERALLKRVGGTYRFIHRLVLDYFADLEQHNVHPSINLPPVQAAVHPMTDGKEELLATSIEKARTL